MAMLDKMKDSINAAGQGISTKIKDGLESERISSQIRNDEKMIEELTHQVGVQCVNHHIEETGTEYEELFVNIRRLRAQIEKEKEELRLATEVKQCPQCGYGNKMSSKFCVKCGASLKEKENPDTVAIKEKYCTNCGFKNDGDALFCINCGNKLEEVSRQTMAEPEAEVLADIEEALEENAEEITEEELKEEKIKEENQE